MGSLIPSALSAMAQLGKAAECIAARNIFEERAETDSYLLHGQDFLSALAVTYAAP